MIEILVVGNPTIDYIDSKYLGPGGPVTYVSNSLYQLGQKRVNIVTSFGKDFSTENISGYKNLLNFESEYTNRFDFTFKSENRKIEAISNSKKINFEEINLNISPKLIYISPVLDEFSIKETKKLMQKYQSSFFVCMPQGWIRKLNGKEVEFDFSEIENIPYFDILFFSDEEIANCHLSINKLRKLSKVLVITKGKKGVSVYSKEKSLEIEPVKVKSVNTIGAGDIFSTVFSLELYSSNNLISAGDLANEIAARSIQHIGLGSVNSNVFSKALKK